MKLLNLLICLLVTSDVFAQDAQMTVLGKYRPAVREESDIFQFILPDTDTAGLGHVATFRAVTGGKKSTIENTFFDITTRGRMLGANCFKLTDFKKDTLGRFTYFIEAYFCDKPILKKKMDRLPTNKVFVFCSEKQGDEMYSLKVDDVKKEFKSGTYLAYTLEKEKVLKLSKGGMTGATAKLKYKENKPAIFLTVSGFGLGGALPSGVVGLSFNTGRITVIDHNLGYLLTYLLEQAA